MSQIKQLLRLHKKGDGAKTIAKSLGISKNTVKSYLGKLSNINMSIDELLSLEDPELELKFHAGNPAYKDPRFEHLKSHLGYFEKELGRVGVTKKVLWEEYKLDYPNGYEYTQFCHHLKQQLIARNPSAVLEHKPAEKLYVDFAGKKLSYIDRETGEEIWCPVFVACLPYSDYTFVMAVRSQGIEDFLKNQYSVEQLKEVVELVRKLSPHDVSIDKVTAMLGNTGTLVSEINEDHQTVQYSREQLLEYSQMAGQN